MEAIKKVSDKTNIKHPPKNNRKEKRRKTNRKTLERGKTPKNSHFTYQ